jgi:IclR family mhp operon transcriptional activator
VKRIRALSRGLMVLRVLEDTGPLTLHELSLRTSLAKATLLRMLATLEAESYIRRGLGDQLYHLNIRGGPPPREGWKAVLAEVAGPVLDRLCHDVLWPSDIGVYEDGAIRILETSRRLTPILLNRDVLAKDIHVLQSAMGRAFLAWCSEDRRREVLGRLSSSRHPYDRLARDRRAVEELLADVRANGFGTRHPGYFVTQPRESRVSAIAVPVFVGESPIGAVNLIWVTRAMAEAEFAREYGPRLRASANEISTGVTGKLRRLGENWTEGPA